MKQKIDTGLISLVRFYRELSNFGGLGCPLMTLHRSLIQLQLGHY